MQSILIIEDDIIISNGIKIYLQKQGYRAECAFSIAEAAKAMLSEYSLIILDINLPDGSGLDLCKEIRKKSHTPIIMLTANDTDQNMIDGFEVGCDDYISKPFSVDVLNQRIKAVLRRSSSNNLSSDVFTYKDLKIDFNKMYVTLSDVSIKLSVTEYKLLEMLIKNRGQVLTRNLLFEKLWDCDGNYIDENTLTVHIKRLRQKLNEDTKNPQFIITVFGIGYTFGEA